MGNGINSEVDCSGRLCGYGIYRGRIGCSSGNGSCREAKLLEAKVSEFYTEALLRATKEINAILRRVHEEDAKKREGRKLSFLHTNTGSLLAWVEHGTIVTEEDDDETIAKALGLEGWDTEQSAQQAY